MHTAEHKSECDATPARQDKSKRSTSPGASEQLNSKPLGGINHCIGTGREIVDAVFHYIQTKCASHGGTLTDTELTETQMEFVDDFQFMFDLFEGINARCMNASCATAPRIFTKDRMLSSLLLTCSRSVAAHAFSSEVQDLRGDWLNTFYVALSDFVRQYVSLNAEVRLTSAYIKASYKHGQKLTIKQLLQEPTVQNVLRECLRGFETPGFIDALLARLSEQLVDPISEGAGFGTPQLRNIAIGQMREFLIRLPDEIKNALKQFAPVEMAR